jgi:hypothetical protein
MGTVNLYYKANLPSLNSIATNMAKKARSGKLKF